MIHILCSLSIKTNTFNISSVIKFYLSHLYIQNLYLIHLSAKLLDYGHLYSINFRLFEKYLIYF